MEGGALLHFASVLVVAQGFAGAKFQCAVPRYLRGLLAWASDYVAIAVGPRSGLLCYVLSVKGAPLNAAREKQREREREKLKVLPLKLL